MRKTYEHGDSVSYLAVNAILGEGIVTIIKGTCSTFMDRFFQCRRFIPS